MLEGVGDQRLHIAEAVVAEDVQGCHGKGEFRPLSGGLVRRGPVAAWEVVGGEFDAEDDRLALYMGRREKQQRDKDFVTG